MKMRHIITAIFILMSGAVFSDIDTDRDNLRKATLLIDQLKAWEETENWEKFFENKHDYKSRIDEYLGAIADGSPLDYQARYIFWKSALIFNGASRQTFEEFMDSLTGIKAPDKEVVLYLENVISELDKMERSQLKNRLTIVYKDFLKHTGSASQIKEQAVRLYQAGDIISSVSLFRMYIVMVEDKSYLHKELREIIELYADTGVNDNSDSLFAEEMILKLFEVDPAEKDNEALSYVRAYNLERMGNYELSVELYKEFISKFEKSSLIPEIEKRTAYLSEFKLTKSRKNAGKGYKNLKARDLNYNEEEFFDLLEGRSPLLGNNMASLSVSPAKSLSGRPLFIGSQAMSSDTGCLVPQGLYLWFGDLGDYKIETNTSHFKTHSITPGFKMLGVVQKSVDGFLGYDSFFFESYSASLVFDKEEYAPGDTVSVELKIEPYLPEEIIDITWEVSGSKTDLTGGSADFIAPAQDAVAVRAYITYFGRPFAVVEETVNIVAR